MSDVQYIRRSLALVVALYVVWWAAATACIAYMTWRYGAWSFAPAFGFLVFITLMSETRRAMQPILNSYRQAKKTRRCMVLGSKKEH